MKAMDWEFNIKSKLIDFSGIVILKDKSLKSIRDLNKSHIPILQDIIENVTETIWKLFSIKPATAAYQIRLFLHHQPTFYHLHFFVNGIDQGDGFTFNAHLINQIIENLENCGDYYETATIPFEEKEDFKLIKNIIALRDNKLQI